MKALPVQACEACGVRKPKLVLYRTPTKRRACATCATKEGM